MTTPLCTKAAQLVRLLSSDQVGEAGAAAMALCRTVSAAGRDIHWLADLVESALAESPATAPLSIDDVAWEDALDVCLAHIREFDDRSQAFLRSLSRWRGEPSERQKLWLFDLYQRLADEEVGA